MADYFFHFLMKAHEARTSKTPQTFTIENNKYVLSHSNGWYQLTKNGGGYKSEFYTLGIKDPHDIADHGNAYTKEA